MVIQNNNDMWQVCPLCLGSGVDPTGIDPLNMSSCPVCNTKRIISEVTGLPPTFEQFNSSNGNMIFPIRRGCDKKNCDCDGSCGEITGYEFE